MPNIQGYPASRSRDGLGPFWIVMLTIAVAATACATPKRTSASLPASPDVERVVAAPPPDLQDPPSGGVTPMATNGRPATAGPEVVPWGLLYPLFAPHFVDMNPDEASHYASNPHTGSGGRVNGLAADTLNPDVFFAASEWGGIYKSTDRGATWNHLDDHIPQTTWDVEVDPNNSIKVYATSFSDGRIPSIAGIQVSPDGGANWYQPVTARPPLNSCTKPDADTEPSAFGIGIRPDESSEVYIGTNCGVAMSKDWGNSWTWVDPDPVDDAGNPDKADYFWDVVVQPGGPLGKGIVDVCGRDGHYRSVNGGMTWIGGAAIIPKGHDKPCSIAVSPFEPDVIYVYALPNFQDRVYWMYESWNGGADWNVLGSPNNGLKGRIPHLATNERSDGSYDLWSGDGSLYRANCTPGMPGDPTPRCPDAYFGFCQGVCYGDGVTPCTDNSDCAGLGTCFGLRTIPCTSDAGVAASLVGGVTVPDPTRCIGGCIVKETRSPWADPPGWEGGFTENMVPGANAHSDAGDLAFDASQPTDACPVLFSSDGGVYFNSDTASTCQNPSWQQPQKTPHGLWLWGMDGVDRPGDMFKEDIYFGCQDTGLFETTDAGFDVDNPEGADFFDVVADENRVVTYTLTGGLDWWTPGLGTKTDVADLPPGTIPTFNFVDFIDQYGPNQYIAVTKGALGGAFITSDITADPTVWMPLGGNTPSTGFCGVYVSAPPGDTPVFFARNDCNEWTSSSTIWRHVGTSPGGSWDPLVDTDFLNCTGEGVPYPCCAGPSQGACSDLTGGFGVFAVDPNNPDRIYAANDVTNNPHMVVSADGGDTWRTDARLDYLMTGGGRFLYLPALGTTEPEDFGASAQPSLVAFDQEDSRIIVAGSQSVGLFISQNGGGRWDLLTDPFNPAASGIPHLPQPRFAYFDHEPIAADVVNVWLGTVGRGVWRISVALCEFLSADDDGDGWGNECDNCPAITNLDQWDADGDGYGDRCDTCVDLINEDQTDTDGDYRGDVCDCSPFDDGTFAPPTLVERLMIAPSLSGDNHIEFSMESQVETSGSATAFDLLAGDLGLLGTPDAFTDAICRYNNAYDSGTTAFHPAPLPGGVTWFLLRAQNGCGSSSFDSSGPQQQGSRDPGLAQGQLCV